MNKMVCAGDIGAGEPLNQHEPRDISRRNNKSARAQVYRQEK
ncbi:hypothetical protein [Oceanobacillus chungangensis]|nr:hypothetical protein [Oceanobacillus chungangensis]